MYTFLVCVFNNFVNFDFIFISIKTYRRIARVLFVLYLRFLNISICLNPKRRSSLILKKTFHQSFKR